MAATVWMLAGVSSTIRMRELMVPSLRARGRSAAVPLGPYTSRRPPGPLHRAGMVMTRGPPSKFPGEIETDGVDEVRGVVADERAGQRPSRLVDGGGAGEDQRVGRPQRQGLAESILHSQGVAKLLIHGEGNRPVGVGDGRAVVGESAGQEPFGSQPVVSADGDV